jgi:membrane-anchored protein YejM (alkaline phosphatase superfamily)
MKERQSGLGSLLPRWTRATRGAPGQLAARSLRRAVLELWLVNIALSIAIGSSFLAHMREAPNTGLRGWLFALAALVSTMTLLTSLLGVPFLAWAGFARGARRFGATQAFVWTLFQVLLFVDTRIYNLFGYHFNGQIWDLAFTRGSQDAVHFGWQVWGAIFGGLGSVTIAQYVLWSRCLVHVDTPRAEQPLWLRCLRPGLAWSLVLLPAICLEKTIYAQADLSRDRELTALAKLFPFYPRLPAQDIATLVLGQDEPPMPRIESTGQELAYPRAYPRIPPTGPRPNVLVVVIDCWRRDMLSSAVTPGLARFAQSCRSFENHVSGGNSTRFGVFSLLYGMHGSYWFPVYAQLRSPVLLDVLQSQGYDCRAFTSASANYPELRQTAFAGFGERLRDTWGVEEPWRRDELAAAALVDWQRERAQRAARDPWFGFLFLDSPHQTYSHPPGVAPFQPAADGINYMEISSGALNEDRELLLRVYNRYRNAVHHAAETAANALAELERAGALENTIVVVTGDHGEEFLEHGAFGHTSNFAPAQVAVPFLLRMDGLAAGVETRPTTHIDLPSTLLEALGADPAEHANWCQGRNLLDPPTERRRVVAGWHELGLWTADGVLRIPLQDRSAFDIEVYDYDWKLVLDDREVLDRHTEALAQLAHECRWFLRVPALP